MYSNPCKTIDGNETLTPIAYCKSHHGYLTAKQLKLHRCLTINCCGLRKIPGEFWDERDRVKGLRKERKMRLMGS